MKIYKHSHIYIPTINSISAEKAPLGKSLALRRKNLEKRERKKTLLGKLKDKETSLAYCLIDLYATDYKHST